LRSFGGAKLQACGAKLQLQGVLRQRGAPRAAANRPDMRNRQLRSALHAFAEEAAWQLASDVSEGHEMTYEVVEAGGRRRDTPLYCYRPLTADFIDQRLSILARLPSYLPAVHALGSGGGLEDYLRARVARGAVPKDARERAELALRAFLGAVFEDASEFVLEDRRFDRAYEDLEDVVHEGRTETVVIGPVLGLEIASDEINMGDGLSLVRGDLLEDAPLQAAWTDRGEPVVLAVLRWEAHPGDEAPLHHANVKLARLLTALRLFDAAGVTLGPAAWTRTAGGPWTALALGGASGGYPVGTCVVTAQQEDELRAFCSLVGRRTPRNGELAWALRRFELGCARERAADTVTDHLLALRALLEPEGAASGRLPGRVAALCAEPDERVAATERIAHAIALEHALISGVGMPEPGVAADLIAELSDHLRAILRDVLCGHLDSDLRRIADELIAASAQAPV
jgi:hypothetical protein